MHTCQADQRIQSLRAPHSPSVLGAGPGVGATALQTHRQMQHSVLVEWPKEEGKLEGGFLEKMRSELRLKEDLARSKLRNKDSPKTQPVGKSFSCCI